MLKKGTFLLLFLSCMFFSFVTHARIVFSTIDTPGFYQLADNLTNSVTITVSNVTFDLNGHTIAASNGIIINGGLDEICIQNGVIEADLDGVRVGAGCTNITLENVKVKDAIRGFNFENVTGGMIAGCEMSSNTTGLELDNSHKIVVKDCVASCNTQAGYCLLSSTTNCFENCKALSTGEGNTQELDNLVAGFISADGYGNIFERCIANSTQAITTSDSNSLIAGFALRGSEKCSKVVDSEAANGTTDPTGFAVPYGILLEGTLDPLTSVTEFGVPGTANYNSFSFSPDGKYFVAGGDDNNFNDLQIFKFNENGEAPELLAGTINLASGTIQSVDWASNGKHIAVGINATTDVTKIRIFSFDATNNALTFVTDTPLITGSGEFVTSLDWSPDSKYLAVGINRTSPATTDYLRVFEFDQVTGELNLVVSAASGTSGIPSVDGVNWSPDGLYIAARRNVICRWGYIRNL